MVPKEKYYLHLSKASDLKSPKERFAYRAFEILPGALAWATLGGVVLLSWAAPVWIAVFIIAFDIYWLLKTVYLSLHLRSSYFRMRRNMRIDWLKRVKKIKDKDWRDIYHLIILPVYKESEEVVGACVRAVIDSDYPKDKMIVILAIEERVGQPARDLAKSIEKKFGDKFYRFLVTVHPDGLAGEMRGKGANTAWAARRAKKEIIDASPVEQGKKIPYQNIIVSCFDIDTVVYPKYFSCLTYHYLTSDDPTRTSYQPVPLYNNNIWQAPAISRVVATSGTFWQMIQQQRPERLSTFSSQSISFEALVEVGFWQTNMVSEDSRIFWQCLLYYDGNYQTKPLYYPVSMDANLVPSFWKTVLNVYRQQRRWGWGVENIPYLLFGFLKNKKISLGEKIHWTFVQLEGFWSWATNALIIFLLGWLPLYLGGERFNVTLLSYNLPFITRTLMTLAMVGLIGSAIYSTLLLPPRPRNRGPVSHLLMVVQWALVPFTILVFGAIPGLEAQTRLLLGKYMGFWVTPKGRAK